MRYVGVDVGDVRTGLALGDASTGIASPLDVIEVPMARESGAALRRAILARAREAVGGAAFAFVVGLPLHMEDSTETPRSRLVRSFAAGLSSAAPVVFHDERLTTEDARRALAGSGLTRGQKKARKDAVAAAIMLRGYLSTLASSSGPERANDP